MARQPDNFALKRSYQVALRSVGGAYEDRGDLDTAAKYYRLRREVASTSAAADPRNADWRRDEAAAEASLAGALRLIAAVAGGRAPLRARYCDHPTDSRGVTHSGDATTRPRRRGAGSGADTISIVVNWTPRPRGLRRWNDCSRRSLPAVRTGTQCEGPQRDDCSRPMSLRAAGTHGGRSSCARTRSRLSPQSGKQTLKSACWPWKREPCWR